MAHLCHTLRQVLLDTLVKPRLPIINYRTQWSGITAQLLENVTVTQVIVIVTHCLVHLYTHF